MKCAMQTPAGSVVFREIEPRPLGPDDIRVRVQACGICGTDLHTPPALDGEKPFGHEVAGVVVAAGDAVDRVAVGERVVLDSATPCGRCADCRNRRQHLCTDLRSFYFYDSFGFAEEIVAPSISAIPYAGLTPAGASLQEPLGVALDVFKLVSLEPGLNTLVMGLGPIGLMALALAKNAGAGRLFACEFAGQTARCRLARSIGVDALLDPAEQPVDAYDFGCRIDRIIVTSPPATLPAAIRAAGQGAIISYIGIGWGDRGRITFDADQFHFKKLQLRGSFASPAHYGSEALDLLRRGVVDPAQWITHTYPLEDLEEAIRAARQPDAVKVVVVNE